MAAPVAPTKTSLKTAAWNVVKSNPNTTDLALADTWMEIQKSELVLALPNGQMKSLFTRSTLVLEQGRSAYTMPTNMSFYGDSVLSLISGTVTGTATAGTQTTITLAAGHSITKGQWILIVAGTGKASLAQCISVTGQAVTVSPPFSAALDNTSVYVIITTNGTITKRNIALYPFEASPQTQNTPKYYYPFEGKTVGEMLISPCPNGIFGVPYMFNENFQTIDLTESGTLISTIYHKLHAWWHHGLLYRVYENVNDPRAEKQKELYYGTFLPWAITQESVGSN
jgi:hypothetical protein